MLPHHIINDFFHELRMEFSMYTHKKTPDHYLGLIEKGKNPIVIIPGVGHAWAAQKHLADYISLKGYPVYIVKELGFNYKDIPYSASLIIKFIKEKDLKNVILVGHSKGGLIGKYLLQKYNQDGKVIGLISLSTPYSGTHLANFLIFNHWKMFSPKSDIMKDLQDNSVNNKIISIYPKSDTVVWHKDKSKLNGSLENIEVNHYGHVKLTFEKDVQEKVIKSIEKLSREPSI